MATTVATPKETVNSVKPKAKEVIQSVATHKKAADDIPIGILYLLCIFLPFVAVGLVTDWGMPFIYNILWCIFGFWLLGVIHAFIVVTREKGK